MTEQTASADSPARAPYTFLERSRPWLIPIIATALAYWLGAKAGLTLALVRDQITPLWPPTGVAVAALLWTRGRAWPGVLLGAIAVNAPLGPSVIAATLIVIGNTIAPLLAYLILRHLHFDQRMARFRDALALTATGIGAMTVSATVGTCALALTHSATYTAWWIWWTGDAMGVMAITPVLLVAAQPSLWRKQLGRKIPETILAVVVAVVLIVEPLDLVAGHPLFVLFPVIIWVALRLQISGAAPVACLVTTIAASDAAHLAGPFELDSVLGSIERLQAFNVCVAVTAYLLAALATEWRTARGSLAQAGLKLEDTVATRTRELTEALEETRQAQALLSTIFDSTPLGFTVVALNEESSTNLDLRRSLRINSAFAHMLGYEPEELLNTNQPFDITHPDDHAVDRAHLTKLLASSDATATWQKRYLHKDGRVIWAQVSVSAVRDPDGTPQFLVNFVEDITERKAAELALQHRADHDPLTGLKNRAVLDAALASQIAYTRRSDAVAAVMLLDLDGLKGINDRYGHQAGDEAIVALTQAIESRIRSSDLASRLGGDEFVVLLRDTSVEDARAVGDQIRTALHNTPLRHGGSPLSVSIGYAQVDSTATTPANLLAAADASMYAAKHSENRPQPVPTGPTPAVSTPLVTPPAVDAQEHLQLLIEASPNAMLIANSEGRIVLANREMQTAFGYTHDELLALHVDDLVPPERRHSHHQLRQQYFAEPQRRGMGVGRELHGISKDGRSIPVEIGLNPITICGEAHVLASIIDITDRLRAQEAAHASRQAALVQTILTTLPMSVIATDNNGSIVSSNPAAEEMLGYSAGALVGRNLADVAGRRLNPNPAHSEGSEPLHGTQGSERFYRRSDGTLLPVSEDIVVLRNEQGTQTGYLAVAHDITQRIQGRHQLKHMLRHDPLTNLPNRVQLLDQMAEILSHAETTNADTAVVLLDLDHFKRVNDTVGHEVGDALLEAVAQRLSGWVNPGGAVARLGGDEFVIVIPSVKPGDEFEESLNDLMREMLHPFEIDGYEVAVTASAGVTLAPADGDVATSLLRNAEIAMYHAKAGGRESLARFEITMLEDLNEKVALSRALRQALTNNELFVVYQPQYDLHDGRLTGFEALARWESPEFGLVSPNRFIPIAEDSGLILRLGEWVMNQACTDIVALEEALGMPLRLAVNVSARQLRGADWLTQIIDTLERTHVVPSRFAMEITESTLLEDHHEVRGALAQLREHGIKVVVDDFGQGYSSLAYLTTLPVDEIKLDRSFVEALGRDRGSDAIVDAILTMAQALDMDVVAEGVETLAQEDYLRSRGCDHVQGFLYGCGVRVADAKNATTHIGRP